MDNNNNEIEVLGQTGVVDVVPVESKNKKEKKAMSMNLKTLFALGLGVVAVIVLIIVLLVNTKKNYTVTFDTTGGSKIASVTVKKGEKVEKPKDPTKEEYSFVEWQLNGKKYDFSKEVTKNITLKATWEIALTDEEYTIVFDSKGGSLVESQIVHGNGQVLKPDNPTKEHHKFIEWQLNDEKYDFDALVKEDMTLTAIWESLPRHYVTFDESKCGGSTRKSEVFEGDTVDKPKDPENEGYTFVEWQKDGQKYNFETPVIDDLTLEAKCDKIQKYQVTFDTDGSKENIPGQEVKPGETAKKPATIPEIPNKVFAAWQLNSQDYDFSTPVTSDITLKARYEDIKHCNLELNAPSLTMTEKITVKCGAKVTESQVYDKVAEYCKAQKIECIIDNSMWFYIGADGSQTETKFDFNTAIDKDIKITNKTIESL